MFIIRYSTLVPRLIICYTDGHEVDEDETNIVCHDTMWTYENTAGFMRRNLSDPANSVYDAYASRVKKK